MLVGWESGMDHIKRVRTGRARISYFDYTHCESSRGRLGMDLSDRKRLSTVEGNYSNERVVSCIAGGELE